MQPVPNTRIVAFDILRGLMLVIMLIDHIELYPSILDYFTGRGRYFVSAAEGFFFLSGLLVGMVYTRRITRGTTFIFGRMWLRAIELYILAAVTTIGYALWATWANKTSIKYGLPTPTDWGALIRQTFELRYGFGWADFLARFSILMFIAPFAFYGLMKGYWRIVLSLSIFTWFLRDQNFTFAWQLLFIGGMVVGYYWNAISNYFMKLPTKTAHALKWTVYFAAGISFIFSYLVVYLLSFLNAHLESIGTAAKNFTLGWNNLNESIWVYAEKWTLGPLRVVLFLLWFSALFMLINKHGSRINQFSKGTLELLGQNSLFVYLLHSFVVFAFKLVIPSQTNRWQNFAITSAALVALIAGTMGYRKLRRTYPNFVIKHIYSNILRPFRWISGYVTSAKSELKLERLFDGRASK